MKKIVLLLIVSLFIFSCSNKNGEEVKEKNKTEITKKKFGGLDNFIKANITDKQAKELKNIFRQRSEIQAEIKNMIKNVTKDSKDEVYLNIIEKRKKVMNMILPYVSTEKQLEFVNFCGKYNKAIKKKLDVVTKK